MLKIGSGYPFLAALLRHVCPTYQLHATDEALDIRGDKVLLEGGVCACMHLWDVCRYVCCGCVYMCGFVHVHVHAFVCVLWMCEGI